MPRSLISSYLFGVVLLLAWVGGCGDDDTKPPTEKGRPTCLGHTDCPDGYFCYQQDPAQAGICARGCKDDTDCVDGEVCNANHLCTAEEQPGCTGDGDCADPSTYCDLASGECKQGCRDDGCPGDQQCVEHACVPRPPVCADDEDCPSGTWCNLDVPRGRCDPGCRTNSDCPPEQQYCVVAQHRCTDCPECPWPCDDGSPQPDDRCPAGRYCDETSRTCLLECVTDEDCEAGHVCCSDGAQLCRHRMCVPACQEEGLYTCPEGYFCRESGHCQRGCRNDRECAAYQICDEATATCLAGCRDDQGCPAGSYCLTAERRCEAGCRDDAECRTESPHLSCLAHQCLPTPCTLAGGQCPAGYYCDGERLECSAGCADDGDCSDDGSRVCNPLHQCVDACQSNDDCEPDRLCDPTGHCVLGCRDDGREPDDAMGQAQQITLADGPYESPEQRLCAGNVDWFVVELEADQGLRAEIRYVSPLGDLALTALDIAGTTLASSALPGQASQALEVAMAPEARTVFLQVSGLDLPLLSGRSYRLSASLVEPGVCADDGQEPNDGYLQAIRLHDGTLGDLVLCPDDEDWYFFVLQVGDHATMTLSTDGAGEPPSLELYDLDGAGLRLLAFGSSLDDPPGTVVLDLAAAPHNGQYYLKVSGANAEALDYGLLLELEGHPICVEDALEMNEWFQENDEQWQATTLPGELFQASWPDLMLCSGDEDWYSLRVLAGERLYAAVRFDGQRTNLDLELYRGGERIAVAAQANTDYEAILVDDLLPAVYQLRVFGWDGRQEGAYALDVEKRLAVCTADLQEENDTPEEATPLACGPGARKEGLIACNDDPDYFRVHVVQDREVEALLGYRSADGEVDLELLDAAGQTLIDSGTVTEQGRTLGTTLRPGTYYLVVQALGNQPCYYSLELGCRPAQPACTPDAYESNDAADGAYWLGVPADIDGLNVCSGTDEDWFAFEVWAGTRIDAALTFFHFDGDLGLRLYCTEGLDVPVDVELPAAVSDDANDNEQLSYVVPADGYCFVRVTLRGEPQHASGTPYGLTIDTTL